MLQDKRGIWKRVIGVHEKDNSSLATQLVKGILKPLMLRRTKDSTIYGRPLITL